MVCTFVLETTREETGVMAIRVHYPNAWHATRFGMAEDDLAAIG